MEVNNTPKQLPVIATAIIESAWAQARSSSTSFTTSSILPSTDKIPAAMITFDQEDSDIAMSDYEHTEHIHTRSDNSVRQPNIIDGRS